MEEIIKDICNYIIANIDEEIAIKELEENFYYNKFYIIRAFKKTTGYTIKEFTNKVKVLKTIDPLLFTDDTILKIALNNGFNSQEYYSETFKNVIGISPVNFRKEYTNIDKIENIEELKEKRKYLEEVKEYEQYLLDIPTKKEDVKELRKVA